MGKKFCNGKYCNILLFSLGTSNRLAQQCPTQLGPIRSH